MRTTRAVVAALLLALVGLGAPGVALAAQPEGPAYLRLAHLSPDTPSVDVYVDSAADPSRSFVVPGVGYGVCRSTSRCRPTTTSSACGPPVRPRRPRR